MAGPWGYKVAAVWGLVWGNFSIPTPPVLTGVSDSVLAPPGGGVPAVPYGHPCRSRAPFPLPFVSILGLLQPPLPTATEPLPFPW